MSTIFVDYEPVEVEAGKLSEWLFKQHPHHNVISLDTEASGLYVDGGYDESPPARVSVVSMAWKERGGKLTTVALPFDQGRIAGKPGRWSQELEDYEPLDGPESLDHNLSQTDWEDLTLWLDGFQLDLPAKGMVYHNAKYDLHIMNAGHRVYGKGIDLLRFFAWDTMLAQGIIDPLDTSALKPTGERLWGYSARIEEQAVHDALKHNGVGLTKRYDLVDWLIMGPYAAKDAELTYMLWERQQQLIDEGAVTDVDLNIIDGYTDTPIGRIATGEKPLAALLYKMELRRVGLDAPAMRDEADKMVEAVKQVESELPFSPPTINGAKKYFFEELGIVPVKVSDVCGACTFNRAKGVQRKNTKKELCKGDHKWNPGLDGEVVARLVADGVPAADQWQHLANMNSALSKWYRAWPYKAVKTADGWRIMTNFRQGRIESDRKGMTSGGAISGRLSAERVQLQGVPKEYRIPESIRGIKPKKDGTPGLITAKPGYQLWEIDASNAEVRVAAWAAQCEPLAEVINSGANIHDGNTRALFGIEKDNEDWEQYRDLAKIGVFSELYGAGVRTMTAQFAQGLGKAVPERVAREFKQAINAAYPELKRTARKAQGKADKSMGGCGYVRLVNGRKRVFGWAERTHKAFNAVIQGGVAEMMKVLMLMVEQEYPGALINQVHDSVWVELPELFADLQVAEIQQMGAELFTQAFSTPDLPINFKFDAKQLA